MRGFLNKQRVIQMHKRVVPKRYEAVTTYHITAANCINLQMHVASQLGLITAQAAGFQPVQISRAGNGPLSSSALGYVWVES